MKPVPCIKCFICLPLKHNKEEMENNVTTIYIISSIQLYTMRNKIHFTRKKRNFRSKRIIYKLFR